MRRRFSNFAHSRVRSKKFSTPTRPAFEYRFNGEFGYHIRKLAAWLEFWGDEND